MQSNFELTKSNLTAVQNSLSVKGDVDLRMPANGTGTKNYEFLRWSEPAGPNADMNWDVFIQSLKVREKDDNGLPKYLDCPELYGPAGSPLTPRTSSTAVNQFNASKGSPVEWGQISPATPSSSEGSPNAMYTTIHGNQHWVPVDQNNVQAYESWKNKAIYAIKYFIQNHMLEARFEQYFGLALQMFPRLPTEIIADVNFILRCAETMVEKAVKKENMKCLRGHPEFEMYYDVRRHLHYNQVINNCKAALDKSQSHFEVKIRHCHQELTKLQKLAGTHCSTIYEAKRSW